jgi:hypothetical protein
MKDHSLIRRFFALTLALGAFVFFFTLAFPHFHDESNLSDQEHSCLVCKIQKCFSSTDVAKPVLASKPKLTLSFHLDLVEIHNFSLLFSSNVSRAPPVLN